MVNEGDTYEYQYFLKDHLGNTRVTFTENGNIIQEDAYYPFGMQMNGLCYESGTDFLNKNLYNGKELQDDFGLDWYDYGARFYDAALGRWHVSDPLAEKYAAWSPYNYVMNNPLIFIDPDGQKVKLANNHAGAMTNIAKIAATSLGSHVMNRLISNPKTYTMSSTFFSRASEFVPDSRNINYVGNPWLDEVPRDGGLLTSMIAMGHESWHASDHTEIGFTNKNVEESFNLRNALETKAVSFANYLRDAYSLEPSRNQYVPYKGDFHQFTGGGGSEKISNFTTLGTNKDETSMGFNYTITTKTVLSYKKFGVFKVPDETKTETATYYMTVSMDADNNVSFQIYNNMENYNNATSNW